MAPNQRPGRLAACIPDAQANHVVPQIVEKKQYNVHGSLSLFLSRLSHINIYVQAYCYYAFRHSILRLRRLRK